MTWQYWSTCFNIHPQVDGMDQTQVTVYQLFYVYQFRLFGKLRNIQIDFVDIFRTLSSSTKYISILKNPFQNVNRFKDRDFKHFQEIRNKLLVNNKTSNEVHWTTTLSEFLDYLSYFYSPTVISCSGVWVYNSTNTNNILTIWWVILFISFVISFWRSSFCY